jgi:hypothetical protein
MRYWIVGYVALDRCLRKLTGKSNLKVRKSYRSRSHSSSLASLLIQFLLTTRFGCNNAIRGWKLDANSHLFRHLLTERHVLSQLAVAVRPAQRDVYNPQFFKLFLKS